LYFVIFQTESGKVNIDVYFQDETLWLTQKLIAKLFEKGRSRYVCIRNLINLAQDNANEELPFNSDLLFDEPPKGCY
jgi:hypothetical protein